MVVQARNRVVVWSRVEYLPYLLQEALPVELRRANKGVLSQKDVLSLESCVEAVMKEVG